MKTRIIGILTVGMNVRVNMKVRLRDMVTMRMKVRVKAREGPGQRDVEDKGK